MQPLGGVGGAARGAARGASGSSAGGSQIPISGVKRKRSSEAEVHRSIKQAMYSTALGMDRMSLDFLCEQPKIELSSDQLTHLKELFNYFDNNTISDLGTLREGVSDNRETTGYASIYLSEEQLNKLRFIVDHLAQWKTKDFKSTEDRVIFISNALEFEPKPEVKKEFIKHFSECIPQIIAGYNNALLNFGETRAKEQYKTFFSHVATIFKQPEMIHKGLNQMNFSNCSEQTITTMATLFFSDLDEINLEHATLSNDQLKALISGVKESKKYAENATPIKKIILGPNVTCDNDAVLELAEISKDLTHIQLGSNVTCDNDAVLELAKKAKGLTHIHLGPKVTCDNDAILKLAEKAEGLDKIFLGNGVTCDNEALLKLATNAKNINQIFLGHRVTCDNEALLALAKKTKDLNKIFLGNRVTCDNEALLALAANVKHLSFIFLGNKVTCDNEALLALAKNAKQGTSVSLGNGVKCTIKTLKTLKSLGLDVQKM